MPTHFPHPVEGLLKRLIWGSLALIALCDAVGLHVLNITLKITDTDTKLAIILLAVLGLNALCKKLSRTTFADGFLRMSRFFAVCGILLEVMAMFSIFTVVFVLLSYIAAASPYRLYDEEFNGMDRAIGFDWLAYAHWVDARPLANIIFKTAYHSWFQIPALILSLALVKKSARLYCFMLAAIFSVVVCISLSALLPSEAPFTYLKVDSSQFKTLYNAPAYAHITDLNNLRSGAAKTLETTQFKGIITFPSFHAALAVLLAWGFWGARWARWPFLLLDTVMLCAVPVTGGHYLIDLIAGVFIGLIMLWVVKRIAGYQHISHINQQEK